MTDALHALATQQFCCPITGDLMSDPVISRYGVSYERLAIVRAIKDTGMDPVACRPLRNRPAELFENRLLRSAIRVDVPRILGLPIVPFRKQTLDSSDTTTGDEDAQ